VIDISEEKDQPLCLINPEITERDGIQSYEEGCLSVPGFYENVERASTITVKALGRDGKEFKLTTDGLLAVCIQHEMDHLQGKLFVDYISELKRSRIRKKLVKQQKNAEPVSL
jgi:peptide deformylase